MQRVDAVISLLPTLQYGLDVNVQFDNIRSFEYTKELESFDCLGVNLYHGWLVDVQDKSTADVILQHKSYNQLVFKLVEAQTSANSSENIQICQDDAIKNKLKIEAKVIEHFLEDTASQLTYYGLLQLHTSIPDGAMGVFFRNNHFSTLLKRRGALYLLVTDFGYADEPAVAWEVLNEIDG